MATAKSESAVIAYHLRELATARDPESPHYVMPEFRPDARAILDIGCGIGQTFVASETQTAILVGLDVDQTSLVYGRRHFGHIRFVNGTAERLPFADGTFDFVMSRVSLPYTNLARALSEINRVLAEGGTVWFTLHSFQHVAAGLMRSIQALRVKDVFLRLYVILNGVALHVRGWQFPLVVPFRSRRYESFQTIGGMTAAMERSGFESVWVRKSGTHLVCTARKKPPVHPA